MQELFFVVQTWCHDWRMVVNLDKTNILHVRPKRRPRSRFIFLFNHRPVPYCDFYKYLGCIINEFVDFSFTISKQVDSASRALISIVTKMIKNRGFPYSVFSTLYQSCITSISHYGTEIFGFQNYDSLFKLQLRAARSFLGLPKHVTSYGLVSELDWLLPQAQTQVKIVQYLGRLYQVSTERLLSKIFNSSNPVEPCPTPSHSILPCHLKLFLRPAGWPARLDRI